jgi:hypothetical protein
MGSIAGVSPRFTARMAGLFYLLYVVIAGLARLAKDPVARAIDAALTTYASCVVSANQCWLKRRSAK